MSWEGGVRLYKGQTSQISDKVLLKLTADGDKDALKLLYLRYRVQVYQFVLRLTGSETIADEVVNEVFLAVWRKAGQFKAKSQVTTWLMAIARFKAASRYRHRSEAPRDHQGLALAEDRIDSPAAWLEKAERSDILRKCVSDLAPIHQEVISQIYYQERKVEEVAQSTGVPIATIKTRLHYARGRMATLLAKAGIDRAWVAL